MAAVAPDKTAVDKLMPAKVARDATGEPSEALRRKLAALGRPQLATASLAATDGPDRLYVESDGKADTHAFLGRRIDGVMKFEQAKAKWLNPDRETFSVTRFLGRLRYPAR